MAVLTSETGRTQVAPWRTQSPRRVHAAGARLRPCRAKSLAHSRAAVGRSSAQPSEPAGNKCSGRNVIAEALQGSIETHGSSKLTGLFVSVDDEAGAMPQPKRLHTLQGAANCSVDGGARLPMPSGT